MTSGVFTIAETVDAFDGSDRLMSARICQPNHKGGNISLQLQRLVQIHMIPM